MASNKKSSGRNTDKVKYESEDAPLTELQLRFCEEYVVDFNAIRALGRAGYATTTGNAKAQHAAQLLAKPNITKEIEKLNKERTSRVQLEGDEVLQELWNLAFADLGRLIDVDEEGTIKVKKLTDVPPHVRRALSEIKQTKTNRIVEGQKLTEIQTSIKTEAKSPYFKMLVNYLNLDSPRKVQVDLRRAFETKLSELGKKMPPEAFMQLLAALEVTDGDETE